MCDSQASLILTVFCLSWHVLINLTTGISPLESIAVSCGSSSDSTAPDGRVWMGDSVYKSNFLFQLTGKPAKSRAIHHHLASEGASVPDRTARASRREFSYVFPVQPGQKFIRLHFYQDSYRGFEGSTPVFSVKAGAYTLLSNFSTSGVSDAKEITKEYCVDIDDDQELIVTFTPAEKIRRADDFYAFVNGVELVSMPAGLYFTPKEEYGARVIGKKHRFYIDSSTALELVQRLNVGGSPIAPDEDSGMFRRWDEDAKYLSRTSDAGVTRLITVGQESTPPVHIAPARVHQTARTMNANAKSSLKGLTWKIPVDLGFWYLIRLHSLEFQTRTAQSGEKLFSIIINNKIAEDSHSVIHSDGKSGGAAYRDYVVMMEGNKAIGRHDLIITIQPGFESRDEQLHGVLNGLEVFKLSDQDNNLAGMRSIAELQSAKPTRHHKKQPLAYHANFIVNVLTVVLALLNIVVFQLKSVSESDPNSRRPNIRSSAMGHLCRQFSIDEIREATNNFDPQFHIGSGGYGRVYKGSIDRGNTIVAIKRQKTDSRQGENEFQTEIKMLSIRNNNLVSLIGYCNDGDERMLVYQYMSRGSLSDHLFKRNRHPPLPWELKLQISIGAARGLYYLHSRHRVIHRDVKSANILIDENWVAKISDFGLSKMGPANDSFTHISTNIKGTFGYLDPEYFLTKRLTRKSDVYSFGVVLFEVLSGRPAVNIGLEEEQHSLAGWARYCIREGKQDRLIDPNLIGEISPSCLKVFIGIAGRCLHIQPHGRPAMADVVMALELALILQQTGEALEHGDEEDNAGRSYSDHSDEVISMDDINTTSSKGELESIIHEDKPSMGTRSGSSDDQNTKMKKTMGSNNNGSTRWWWDPFGFLPRSPSKPKTSSSTPQVIRQFSFNEIHKATNGFHDGHIIGFGGPDYVYKGYIEGWQKDVAIRMSRTPESRLSMAHELQSKKNIQMKASENQDHVASLIGYCETESDMALVYNYMTNGTLYDQLHNPNKDPLPWKQRLQICIGATKGVSCIHAIVKQTTLHRDLKSTNIWLDESWMPKVSGWGLSRKRGNHQAPIVTGGNWGCLDSDYIRGEELIESSYVYSVGLIMFEVLFAEKKSDRWFDEDQVNLAQWIKSCMRNNFADLVDPFLKGRVSPDSLKTFVETAGRCLLDHGRDRPSISNIETRLEDALKQQEATEGHRDGQLTRS